MNVTEKVVRIFSNTDSFAFAAGERCKAVLNLPLLNQQNKYPISHCSTIFWM